ncbi:MAG TPA: NAD-dependent epimerase/dehydratase family protein, partial [Polyangiaceae bacterium]|nr:NAD-dependent epimerase/dehydratase family protein [Polyangiaceae bacterium]
AFARFHFIEGDIRDREACASAVSGVDIVLHQAALGSVPRSMADPRASHVTNVDGFVNVLLAAGAASAKRIVYASSSSVYGDEPSEPKLEPRRGRLLSPYAATKLIDEIYADTLWRTHGIDSVGLRYFNVFGPRQDPYGAYAAVIPRWTEQLLSGEPCAVYGDGSASRDFCFVDNVVQANLLAALAPRESLNERVFNVACGSSTSLSTLFAALRELVAVALPVAAHASLEQQPERPGDIKHSLAGIELARTVLGYEPLVDVKSGLTHSVAWYAEQAMQSARLLVAGAVAEKARAAS